MDSSAALSFAAVAERYAAVRTRIAVAGGGRGVIVVAVTKSFGAWSVDAAVGCGIGDVGENYAQECVAKLDQVAVVPLPRVHFIGRLQRNKVRRLAGRVDVWQTVDRSVLADEIGRRAPGAEVMIQVNITGAAGQGGCDPRSVEALASRVDDAGLRLSGLMTIGPQRSKAETRACFKQLRRMADSLGLHHCSMGMTDDLETAVEEGATMVRVGRSLFGGRSSRV